MKLSIIIPAYNEEKRITSSLKKIYNYFDRKQFDYEVIVVNDGSRDNTLDVVNKIKNKKTKVIDNKINAGKGHAVKTGMLDAKGDLLLFTDSDLSTPIEEFDKLMKYTDNYDIIIGSRGLKESNVKSKFHKMMLGKLGNFFIRLFAVKEINDTQCGFKLFKRKCLNIFKKQTINRWGFDFEILFLARKFGYKIKEVPVVWVNAEGSKVKALDYPKTFLELLRIRWNDLCGKYK
jgi:dolichyl-phosphate beta-glucosyltransferase